MDLSIRVTRVSVFMLLILFNCARERRENCRMVLIKATQINLPRGESGYLEFWTVRQGESETFSLTFCGSRQADKSKFVLLNVMK
jgi:hypothetical protein